MPCITDISASDEAKHFEILLCKACKYLTKEQIDTLKHPGGGIYDGLDWYVNHLFMDCTHKDNMFDEDNGESALAIKELKRMGYEIQDVDGGIGLVKIESTNIAYPY